MVTVSVEVGHEALVMTMEGRLKLAIRVHRQTAHRITLHYWYTVYTIKLGVVDLGLTFGEKRRSYASSSNQSSQRDGFSAREHVQNSRTLAALGSRVPIGLKGRQANPRLIMIPRVA